MNLNSAQMLYGQTLWDQELRVEHHQHYDNQSVFKVGKKLEQPNIVG